MGVSTFRFGAHESPSGKFGLSETDPIPPPERKSLTTEYTEGGDHSKPRVKQSSPRRLPAELLVTVAGHGVVVHHAGGLHQGVANCGADEAEAAFGQILA
jgi:hypothetical protein